MEMADEDSCDLHHQTVALPVNSLQVPIRVTASGGGANLHTATAIRNATIAVENTNSLTVDSERRLANFVTRKVTSLTCVVPV